MRQGIIGLSQVVAFAAIALSLHVPASGAIIDLLPQGSPIVAGEGNARGVRFVSHSDFNIMSVGIEAPLANKPFDVLIYSGDTLGAPHAAAASALSAAPVADGSWFDVPLSFSFQDAVVYVVLWRPSDGLSNEWSSDIALYNLSDANAGDDTPIPDEFDPILTLTAGRSGADGSDGNSLAPRFRFNAIPEPAAMLLLAAAVVMLARRRAAS